MASPAMKRMAHDSSIGISNEKSYDGYVERVPLKGLKKASAVRMSEAFSHQALATNIDEVDVTELAEKSSNYLPFIVKAVVAGLKAHPYLNSEMDEERQQVVLKKYYNIGVGVETSEGMMITVVKDADKKNMNDIAGEIENFTERVQKNDVDLNEMKGGTFTVLNINGTFFSPTPNYPESAILISGAIHDKPVVIDGKVAVRKILPLSVAFDNRILDGLMVQRFLDTVMAQLNDPDLIE